VVKLVSLVVKLDLIKKANGATAPSQGCGVFITIPELALHPLLDRLYLQWPPRLGSKATHAQVRMATAI